MIAEQASYYFEENNGKFSSNDFFSFLDNRIGVEKLTSAFNVNPPELLTVYFRSDILRGVVNAGTDINLIKDAMFSSSNEPGGTSYRHRLEIPKLNITRAVSPIFSGS